MLIDDGTLRPPMAMGVQRQCGSLKVPPTIDALLTARLDLLDAEERDVIEPASVIGQNFAVPAVKVFAPDLASPFRTNLGLTGKQLVQPSTVTAQRCLPIPTSPGSRRGLQRPAETGASRPSTSDSSPGRRAEPPPRRGQEFEEIHGYHLEQAYRYLTELGTLDDQALGSAHGRRRSWHQPGRAP